MGFLIVPAKILGRIPFHSSPKNQPSDAAAATCAAAASSWARSSGQQGRAGFLLQEFLLQAWTSSVPKKSGTGCAGDYAVCLRSITTTPPAPRSPGPPAQGRDQRAVKPSSEHHDPNKP